MRILRFLLVIAGFLCVGVGTVAIFVPVLPTTPFYLLAVFCFARGSDQFHRWFTGTKLYKKHLEELVNDRRMTIRAKLTILVPVTVMVGLAAALFDVFVMRVVIAALILAKWWYFWFVIRTKT